jgi:eukaryotic-like serine/threonine-protein kinase
MSSRSLRYYDRRPEREAGPYTPQQVGELLNSGQLQPADELWGEGNSQPTSVAEIVRDLAAGDAPDVFISHSSRNKEQAKELVAALEQSGLCCWIDYLNLTPGHRWSGQLKAAIESCRSLLLLESEHANQSPEVQTEVAIARKRRIPIVPVRLDKVQRPDQMEYLLQGYHWIDATEPPLNRHFRKIAEGLRKAIGASSPSSSEPAKSDPVYVGPYRLLDCLGQGGMGEVYRAEQRAPIRRIVALKRIKPGLDSKEVLARFESERQALARMDHPNIARVFDAGKDELGRPYFAMEYVPGKSITEFADEHKLPIEQRLRLFQEVCSAIAHAHTKAIIHRDIKPSNVLAAMVDDRPQVKVIDFGIAKALTADRLTDHSSATQAGLAIGTLESMSPEQAAGSLDIDTRTDVYALGALLYELLCGCKPFDGQQLPTASDEELQRVIREVDPPRPSTRLTQTAATGAKVALARDTRQEALERTLRSELEWIPLKALRKERARRYQSAAELAADIQNYLDNKPLIAGPESLTYRLKKSARRHRGALLAGTLAALAAGVGVFGYISGIRNEQARTLAALENVKLEQARTAAALEEAEAQRQRAFTSSSLAAQRLDEKRLALDQMLASFSDDQLKGQPGSQFVRKLFLQKGLEQYEQLLGEQTGERSVILRVSDCWNELGQVEKELGFTEVSLEQLEKAAAVCRAAVAKAPTDRALQEALGKARLSQAQALFELGRREPSRAAAEECVTIFQQLREESPAEPQLQLKLGAALTRLASLTEDQARQAEIYQKALTHLREAAAQLPEDADCLVHLARCLNNAALNLPTPEEQLAQYQEASTLLNKALALAPGHEAGSAISAIATQNQVSELSNLGRLAEAEALLAARIASLRSFVGSNPAVSTGLRSLATTLARKATLHARQGQERDAQALQAEAVQVCETYFQRAPTDPEGLLELVRAQVQLAKLENREPNTTENIAFYRQTANRLLEGIRKFPNRDDYLLEWLGIESQLVPPVERPLGSILQLSDFSVDLQSLELALGNHRIADSESAIAYAVVLREWLNHFPAATAPGPELGFLNGCLERLELAAAANPKAEVHVHLLRASVAEFLQKNKRYREAADLRRELIEAASKLDWKETAVPFSPQLFAWYHYAPLAECLRQTGDGPAEFLALQEYFANASQYYVTPARLTAPAAGGTYTDEMLGQLRNEFELQAPLRQLRRYPLFDKLDADRKFIQFQVSEAWDLIELQSRFLKESAQFDVGSAASLRVLREIYEGLAEVPGGFLTAVELIQNWNQQTLPLFEEIETARSAHVADRTNPKSGLKLGQIILTSIQQHGRSDEDRASAAQLLAEVDATLATISAQTPEQTKLLAELRARTLLERVRLAKGNAELKPALRQWLLQALELLSSDSSRELRGQILYALGEQSLSLSEGVGYFSQALAVGELAGVEEVCRRITPFSRELLLMLPPEIRGAMESSSNNPAAFQSELRKLCFEHAKQSAEQPSAAATEPEASGSDAAQDQATPAPSAEQQKIYDTLEKTWGAYMKRDIVLLFGRSFTNEPFWVFAAIRTPRAGEFRRAQQAGQVDLEHFEEWGELIVSGPGQVPPRKWIDEVARMYQTDGESLARSLNLNLPSKLEESAESTVTESGGGAEQAPDAMTKPIDPQSTSSWETFLALPDKRMEALLPDRLTHFTKQGSPADLVQTAQLLQRFKQYQAAAKGYLLAAARAEQPGSTAAVSDAREAALASPYSLRQAALDALKLEVQRPDFFDYSGLAAEEVFQPLHQDPEYRALFRVK